MKFFVLLSFLSFNFLNASNIGDICMNNIFKITRTIAKINSCDEDPYCHYIAEDNEMVEQKSIYSISYGSSIHLVTVRYEENTFELVVHPHLEDSGCLIENISYSTL